VIDPYAVLGVGRTAPLPAIKEAWRREALAWHPDRNSAPDATARFRVVQRAWEELREDRAGVDARLVAGEERARRAAVERMRVAAERRAWDDHLARLAMAAELQREMAACPRRDLYDVRFYCEPLVSRHGPVPPPLTSRWRGENVKMAVWDLVNLLVGGR